MHTVYINDRSGVCIATLFAEDGVTLSYEEFLQALPENTEVGSVYLDDSLMIRLSFPLRIHKSFSCFIR
jgi:hypothetical protein